MEAKPFFVVNPNSENGSTGKEWGNIKKEIEKYFVEYDYEFTKGAWDAVRITRSALEKGYKFIVSVGGDGTNNEVVNGFFENKKNLFPDATLGFVNRGTGGDWRKTIGLPADWKECIRILKEGKDKIIDVGWLKFEDHSGNEVERYFINIASFGIGGYVDDIVNKTTKVFGGKVSFFLGTLRATFTYKNRKVRLKIDDNDFGEKRIYNIAVANGKFFGGGMKVAPDADPSDGLFDIVVMGDLNLLEIFSMAGKIYKGKHIPHPKIEVLHGKKIEAYSNEVVLFDIDGEAPGGLPAVIEIIPSSLKIKTI